MIGGYYKAGMNWLKDPLGHEAINSGMNDQRRMTGDANAMLEKMYNQQRQDLEPWQQSGLRALSGMENPDFQRDFTAADFTKDPGYDFRMQEGSKALERSAAARGGLNSGATMKALAQYGQNFASNEYGNAYNRFNADRDRRFGRLSNIAGMGQNAVNQLVGAAGSYGSQYSANQTGLGDAMAGANIARANANQQMTKSAISAASSMKGG